MARKRATDPTESALDTLQDVAIPVVQPGDRPEIIPNIGSDEWTAFILGKLKPDELHDGCPTYEGLRRLCYDYLGTPIDIDVDVRQTPNVGNGNHSCVVARLTIEHPVDYTWLGPVAGRTVRYSHVGDVFAGNDPEKRDTFAWQFSSSTCATRTKAALLRDTFRLKHTYTKEELSAVKASASGADGFAVDSQFRGMDLICRKLKVNAAKYIRHCWAHLRPQDDHANLRRLPYKTAVRVTKEIQGWIHDTTKIPEDFQGYDPSWLEDCQTVESDGYSS